MIKEQECNVSMPSPIDDQYIRPGSGWTTPTPEQSSSPLLPMIQVIGGISKLLQILKLSCLDPRTISAYESHFIKCMDGFQAQQQMRLRDYLDPVELPALMYLQNARLMLHRNNLTPMCNADARSCAIDHCASTAKDTAKFLQRCMQEPPPGSRSEITAQNDTWEKRMVSAASAFFCTHIWRCILFLCFRLDFQNALICARASAVLGSARPINVACGLYLEFYLKELVARLNQGVSFDTDEEMIAYASGDLQGNFESSWIWQETLGDMQLGQRLDNQRSKVEARSPNDEAAEEEKWDGWDAALQTLTRLQREKEQQSSSTVYGLPGSVRRISPPDPERLRTMAQSPEGQAAREKMRIKDLI